MSNLTSIAGKTLTIIGGSGYVGRSIAKKAANLDINVISVSRSGPGSKSFSHPNIDYVQGDAMKPEKFQDTLEKSDAVIFTIGTLLDTSMTRNAEKGSPGTYEHMNRDTAIAIGNCLNEMKGKRFVYISGSASPPFCPRYLSTKMEAEEHLRSLGNLKTVALRPGFIYSASERVWSVPLKYYCDANNVVMGKVLDVCSNNYAKNFLNNFHTDSSVPLDDVVDSSIYCSFSEEYDQTWLWNADMNSLSEKFRQDKFMVHK